MEKTPYLNKALGMAKEELQRATSLSKAFNNSIGELKKIVADNGGDVSIISELQKAAKAGNLQKIQELKNQLK